VLEVPGSLDNQSAEELLNRWNRAHQGPGRYHQPAILANGAAWKATGVSLQDAQYAEAAKFAIEEVARVWGIPPVLLGIEQTRPISAEEEASRWLKFGLGPRLARIEAAFAADPDLFPPEQQLRPCFDTDALLRGLMLARYSAYRLARQGGWTSQNEIRAAEGLPPDPDPRANELQYTPVGGAPNEPDSGTGEPGEAEPATSL
jgi:HK97 family phage portal protein